MKRTASNARARVRPGAWLSRAALAALTACASWAPLQSPARGGAPWRHFVLFTDVESARAQPALREFETLRHALEQVAFPDSRAGEPRVSIVLFSQRSDYRVMGPPQTMGFASPQRALDIERQPTIVFSSDATAPARRIFVHEEVHEMLHRAFGTTTRWLNEGLAEYFSSLRIEKDFVVLGDVVPERETVPADGRGARRRSPATTTPSGTTPLYEGKCG